MDYHVTLRVQNGRLKAAMKAQGFEVVSRLAAKSGVDAHMISNLLNFKISPRSRVHGGWRSSVIKLCKVLVVEPSEVFPEHLDHEVVTNVIEEYSDKAELAGGVVGESTPAEQLMGAEQSDGIRAVLEDCLTEQERKVIRWRFYGGRTLAAIGGELGLTRERVRGIEYGALRKLRHPARIKQLGEYAGVDAVEEVYHTAGRTTRRQTRLA